MFLLGLPCEQCQLVLCYITTQLEFVEPFHNLRLCFCYRYQAGYLRLNLQIVDGRGAQQQQQQQEPQEAVAPPEPVQQEQREAQQNEEVCQIPF